MAEQRTKFADLGLLWRSKEGQKSSLNGKLTDEAVVFLGLPENATLFVQKIEDKKSDKGPDYRLVLAVEAGDGGNGNGNGNGGGGSEDFE